MERYILLVALIAISIIKVFTCASAQNSKNEYLFINYGEEYGVYDPDVIAFDQDSTGFFWIATNTGLFRYDGQYFDYFNHIAGDTLSIPDNKITALEYDAVDDVLWVGTFFGEVSRLDLDTYKFYNPKAIPVKSVLDGDARITSISRYDKDWLILGTLSSGMYFYDLKNKRYIPSSEFGAEFRRIHQIISFGGDTYIASGKGLYSLKKLEHSFRIQQVEELSEIVPVTSIRLHNKNLSLTSRNTLYTFSLLSHEKKVIYQNRDASRFTSHHVDDEDNYWIGTNGSGVLNVSEDGKLLCHYTADVEKNMTLNTDWINDIFISNQQNIVWVGGKGSLGYFDKDHFKFKQKVIDDNGKGNRIYLLFKDSMGCYWYYSWGGVYRSEPDGSNYKLFTYGKEKTKLTERVFEIFEDDLQNVWLASTIGLIKYNLKTNTSSLFRFKEEGVETKLLNRISSVKPSGDSLLWISSYKGLIKFSTKNSNYSVYPYSNKLSQSSFRTNRICIYNDTTVLVGTDESFLLKFNANKKTYKQISVKHSFGSIEKSCYILDVIKDKDDQVWLATYGSGLLQYFVNNDSIASASANQALNLDVYGILPDDDGMLWLSTNTKLVKFNPQDKKITSFSSRDGVNVLEFNDCAFSKSKDGTMLFGGFGGFIEFHPKSLFYNTDKPKVKINSYKLDSKIYANENTGDIDVEYYIPDTIVVSTDEKKVSFYGSVFNYTQSYKNQAAWKLDGYDASWDTIPAYVDKSYSRLPEGTYKLLLKGSNNDGVWSDKADSVVVIVKPTFFKSRLFKVLLVVFSIIILYLIYYLRGRIHKRREKRLQFLVEQSTRKLKKTNDELEESREELINQQAELEKHRHYLEELVLERTEDLEKAREKAEESDRLKTAFLANMSHEIRTPMNSIIGFSSLLSSNLHNEKERHDFVQLIQQSSESLLVLIDDIIDISRIESGQLHFVKKQFQVVDLCNTVYKTLIVNDKIFKGTELKLDIDGVSEDAQIYSDWERLKQVLFNLLNNSLKFTSEGYVKLCLKNMSRSEAKPDPELFGQRNLPDRFFLFSVEDTGIGIRAEDYETIFTPFVKIEDREINYGGMGLGLPIVKQIINALGGDIWLKSTLGVGTTFYFYLPN
ncbi:sensor histidine kinase [Carboxylicivirga linearis]|uniref:histidine kinase n=1 Tax=Carboxylicivirga linearis TaxID=1628157 RepID=A0ABS5JYS5_9BACT|nr:hybrid sensor histidine kinase/response regulator [Carboxylicivirga linearis]MBS2099994.1 hypothetical protein [Carboxylicivirga linearis]